MGMEINGSSIAKSGLDSFFWSHISWRHSRVILPLRCAWSYEGKFSAMTQSLPGSPVQTTGSAVRCDRTSAFGNAFVKSKSTWPDFFMLFDFCWAWIGGIGWQVRRRRSFNKVYRCFLCWSFSYFFEFAVFSHRALCARFEDIVR